MKTLTQMPRSNSDSRNRISSEALNFRSRRTKRKKMLSSVPNLKRNKMPSKLNSDRIWLKSKRDYVNLLSETPSFVLASRNRIRRFSRSTQSKSRMKRQRNSEESSSKRRLLLDSSMLRWKTSTVVSMICFLVNKRRSMTFQNNLKLWSKSWWNVRKDLRCVLVTKV